MLVNLYVCETMKRTRRRPNVVQKKRCEEAGEERGGCDVRGVASLRKHSTRFGGGGSSQEAAQQRPWLGLELLWPKGNEEEAPQPWLVLGDCGPGGLDMEPLEGSGSRGTIWGLVGGTGRPVDRAPPGTRQSLCCWAGAGLGELVCVEQACASVRSKEPEKEEHPSDGAHEAPPWEAA